MKSIFQPHTLGFGESQPLKARLPLLFRATKLALALLILALTPKAEGQPGAPARGIASWYGEAHRGKLMANGQKFDPNKFTAASWFYPLGTKVQVSLEGRPQLNVTVTITDRGPNRRFVREGRIIDLGRAPFKRLAHPDLGLVAVTVTPLRNGRT